MIYVRLWYEYFKIGLFSVGGGLATLPFLSDLGNRTGWFTQGQLADMVAVAESTPGPLGVNMATYVGFQVGGILGSVVAVLGLIAPSVLVVLLIASFLQKFRTNRVVDAVFYGLRPASLALIIAAFFQLCSVALFAGEQTQDFSWIHVVKWEAVILAVLVFVALQIKILKKVHPIIFLALSAVIGMAIKM